MLPARIVALLFFIVALVYALALCRRTGGTSVPLALVMSWLAHGVIYYIVQIILSVVYCCPYPLEVALIINWWSTLLRLWILVAILFTLILIFYRKDVPVYEH